mgnify:CR=1 FL=1
MRVLAVILFLLAFRPFLGWSQLYFPNEQYYNNEIERYFNNHPTNKSFTNSHLSIRPILDVRTTSDSIYFKDSKHYYWITQKLFKLILKINYLIDLEQY